MTHNPVNGANRASIGRGDRENLNFFGSNAGEKTIPTDGGMPGGDKRLVIEWRESLMSKHIFSIGQQGRKNLIAALGVVSSIIGYAISHSISFETIALNLAGPPGLASSVDLRYALVAGALCPGVPLLVVMAFFGSLYLQDHLENQIGAIWKMSLIFLADMFLGLIAYFPFVTCFIAFYAPLM
jgi:hypothetical protein